jgi:hypothetical protein
MSQNITKIYGRTDKKFDGRGQQAICVEFFDTRPNGGDIKDLVRFLESHPKFSTNQTAERIAAYYICVLKKSGHIVLTESSDTVDNSAFYGEIPESALS